MFSFKVIFFDDDGSREQYGFVSSSSYIQAIKELVMYFPENDIESIELNYLNDRNILFAPSKEEVELFVEENNV